MPDRFVFFGTGANFTMAVLNQLQRSNFPPCRVVVPEFPSNRIEPASELQILQPRNQNPLINYAEGNNIPIIYAPQNSSSELMAHLAADDFDFILVACWPYKISAMVCNKARKAAMNIHPSLLPAYRGPDPISAQIESREEHIGVSLHLLNNEFDGGDVIASVALKKPIKLERLYLENQAARLGAEMFIKACTEFGGPEWRPLPQNRG